MSRALCLDMSSSTLWARPRPRSPQPLFRLHVVPASHVAAAPPSFTELLCHDFETRGLLSRGLLRFLSFSFLSLLLCKDLSRRFFCSRFLHGPLRQGLAFKLLHCSAMCVASRAPWSALTRDTLARHLCGSGGPATSHPTCWASARIR